MSTSVASLSCLEGGSGDSDGVMLFEDKGKAEERGESFQQTEKEISQEKKMRSLTIQVTVTEIDGKIGPLHSLLTDYC